jgi:hypothetical protein
MGDESFTAKLLAGVTEGAPAKTPQQIAQEERRAALEKEYPLTAKALAEAEAARVAGLKQAEENAKKEADEKAAKEAKGGKEVD